MLLLQLLLLSITVYVHGQDYYRFPIVNDLPTEVHILYTLPSSPHIFTSSYIPPKGGVWEEQYPVHGLSCVTVAVRVHVFLKDSNVLQPHTTLLSLFHGQHRVHKLWLNEASFTARLKANHNRTPDAKRKDILAAARYTYSWENDLFWPKDLISGCSLSFFQHLNEFLLHHHQSSTLSNVDMINNSTTHIRASCGRSSADDATQEDGPLEEYVIKKGEKQTVAGLAENEIYGCEFSYIREAGITIDLMVLVFGMYEIGVGQIKSTVFDEEEVGYVGIGGTYGKQLSVVATEPIGFYPNEITTMSAHRLILRLLSHKLMSISLMLQKARELQESNAQRVSVLHIKHGFDLETANTHLKPFSHALVDLESRRADLAAEWEGLQLVSLKGESALAPTTQQNAQLHTLSYQISHLHQATMEMYNQQCEITKILENIKHELSGSIP